MNGQVKTGDCEVCEKTQVSITCHYGNMWFCDDCWKLEEEAVKVNQLPENQEARVIASKDETLKLAATIDNNIQVRTDLFNAATVAIVELKKVIDDSPLITNKPYALAEALKARFEHFKTVVFQLNEQLIDAGNNQKAIQIYLNNMANQLRAEEREKLKLADLSYQPKSPTKPTVRKISTQKVKIDKTELAKYVKEIGVSEFMFIQIVNTRKCTLAEAAEIIKKSLEAAKKASGE